MRLLAIVALLVGLGGESLAFDTHALCRGGRGGQGCCALASYTETERCKGYAETRVLEDLMYSGQDFQTCDYLKEHPDVRWPHNTPCLFCRSRLICTGDTWEGVR